MTTLSCVFLHRYLIYPQEVEVNNSTITNIVMIYVIIMVAAIGVGLCVEIAKER